MNKENRFFKGPYGIMLTPFLPNGKVDYNQIEEQADSLCQTGITGLVTCGSTSEFVMLSAEENKQIMKVVANVVGNRKQLICGATGPDSKTSIDYLSYMSQLGAVGALIAPPYYYQYGGDEIVEFYRSLDANCSDVKIIAYQIPSFSSPIPLDKTVELMGLPHVVAMKNSSADIKQIMHQINLRNNVRDDFSILTGTDDALVPCLSGGCDGSFTALACIFPNEICKIYEAVENHDLETALKLQGDLLPLTRLADQVTFPVGYKILAEVVGVLKTSYRQQFGVKAKQEAEHIGEQMRQLLQEKKIS